MTLIAIRPAAKTDVSGIPHQFTVAEYYAMGAAGILTEQHRTELINGEIVDMPPIGDSHAGTVDRMLRALARAVGDDAIVRVQNPIFLNEWSMPQPDIALLRFRSDFYTSRAPTPSDIVLVVEVSVTTLSYDRDTKLPHYAETGIPEVWIVEPQKGRITAFRDPDGARYATSELLTLDDDISVPPGRERIPIRELLGEAVGG